MNSGEITFPQSCLLIPVPLPPMLSALTGHNGTGRFFSLCYLSTKATWSDGWHSGTFSYHAAYEPLVSHPAIAEHLYGRHLGSDDSLPEDALLCDRQDGQIFVGNYDEIERFLREQNARPPVPTAEDLERMRQHLAALTPEEMRERGMFEFLFGPSPEQRQLGGELVAWLDQFITEDLLQRLTASAEAGNLYAAQIVLRFIRRAESQHQDNDSSLR